MSKQLYRYQNSIKPLSEEDLVKVFSDLEKKNSTGKFPVIPGGVSPAMKESIKSSWPEGMRGNLKLKLSDIAGQNRPTPEQVAASIRATCEDAARKDATKDTIKSRLRAAAADLTISFLVQQAPLETPAFSRNVGNIKFSMQFSNKLTRLVVDADKVNDANVYLYGIYDEQAKRSWLLAWAGRKDLLAAPCGNRDTNPEKCSWRRMAHYLEYDALKPMTELLEILKIKEIAPGIMIEQKPSAEDVPLHSGIAYYDASQPDPGDDFENVIFGKTSPQPKASKQDTEDF